MSTKKATAKKSTKKSKKSSSNWLQTTIVITSCFAVIGLAFIAAQFFTKPDGQQINIQVGKSIVLNFPGRESVEYRWVLNKSKSSSIHHINSHMLGWTYTEKKKKRSAKSVFGNNRTSRFEVKGKSAGTSVLTFAFKKRGSSDLKNL